MPYTAINQNAAQFTDAEVAIEEAASRFEQCAAILGNHAGVDELYDAITDELIEHFETLSEIHHEDYGLGLFRGFSPAAQARQSRGFPAPKMVTARCRPLDPKIWGKE